MPNNANRRPAAAVLPFSLRAFGVAVLLAAAAAPAAAEDAKARSAIDYSLFQFAPIRNASDCRLTARAGANGPTVAFGPKITNPAMSCPDAFAWQLFAKVVAERFWAAYGTDETMFPLEPWPACPGGAVEACCAALVPFVPGAETYQAGSERVDRHCPAYPGLAGTEAAPPVHTASAPSKAHLQDHPTDGPDGAEVPWQTVPAIDRTMVIANKTVEVVYRNRAMFDYVLAHDIYHQDGLAQVFARFAENRLANAPYWIDDVRAKPLASGVLPLSRIDFPVDSIMVKTNWLPLAKASSVGIDPARDGPFVTIKLDPKESPQDTTAEDHILLSLHISSKDIPNWVWATFEHVANQGRCDLIGCNDSFGYAVPAPGGLDSDVADLSVAHGANYQAADQAAAQFQAGVDTFAFAGRYGGGAPSPELTALFETFGVGGGAPSGSDRITAVTAADPAWRMYRLKGSMTGFVAPTGEANVVGNSITEAGFSHTSSCMSCHAQAAVDASGEMPFAIFQTDVSYLGFPESVNGAPDHNLYQIKTKAVGTTGVARQIAVQTDFVWGFRFAKPLASSAGGTSD